MAARAAGGRSLGRLSPRSWAPCCPRGTGPCMLRVCCAPPPPSGWPQQQQTVTGSQFLQVWLPGRPRWHLAPGTLSCDFKN